MIVQFVIFLKKIRKYVFSSYDLPLSKTTKCQCFLYISMTSGPRLQKFALLDHNITIYKHTVVALVTGGFVHFISSK